MDVTYYHDLEQGSDAWHEIRLEIPTASEMNNLVTPTGKQASGAKVQAYACDIASQRVNKCIEDNFESFAMQKGHFHEEYARDAYNDNYDTVSECGFIIQNFGVFKIGCSPDGLVGEDGGIEIKSREAKFQVATIVADEVPKEYMNQCQTFLLVTGRAWIDFVQYSTGMPLFVKRVFPDRERHAVIYKAMEAFELLVQKNLAVYKSASASMVETERVDFVIDDIITESEESKKAGEELIEAVIEAVK